MLVDDLSTNVVSSDRRADRFIVVVVSTFYPARRVEDGDTTFTLVVLLIRIYLQAVPNF